MITIIFGKPGAGKSCLKTHFLNTYTFDRKRYLKTVNEIKSLNANSFCLSVPKCNVSTNYDCFFLNLDTVKNHLGASTHTG